MGDQIAFDSWLPWSVIGVGGILGFVLFVELLAIAIGALPVPDGYVIGTFTSLIAIISITYAGYWIVTSNISTDRHGRLVAWCFGGVLIFVLINLGFMTSIPPETPFQAVSWLRWATSIGGGVGAVIGLFEARAIERAVEAEKHRADKNELQQERDQLEEFASIVSHDLRSPLSVASGRLELAQTECESEHLDHVADALDRMDALIDDVLTLAREGQEVRHPEPVDLESLFRECWTTVDTTKATYEITVDRTILADKSRLKQVFENLIRNAVDHNEGNITVKIGELNDGLYIEDTGSGIPEDDREDIFETGYSTNEDGAGFGLSIVKQIIDAHHWRIRVTEGTGGGTRFEINGVEFAAA